MKSCQVAELRVILKDIPRYNRNVSTVPFWHLFAWPPYNRLADYTPWTVSPNDHICFEDSAILKLGAGRIRVYFGDCRTICNTGTRVDRCTIQHIVEVTITYNHIVRSRLLKDIFLPFETSYNISSVD
jgi:hypothetical protein